jgi:hypothetical protein
MAEARMMFVLMTVSGPMNEQAGFYFGHFLANPGGNTSITSLD